MLKCPSCASEVSGESLSCPSCGTALNASLLPTLVRSGESPGAAGKVAGGAGPSGSAQSPVSIDDARFAPGYVLGGRYRIVGLLGRGGMGEVYRAEDLTLRQTVALKLLPEAVSGDPAALERFRREVRVARQISHPNVCRVYDIGQAEGLHFLSMEYIRGEELASVLRRFGRLPPDKAVEIARQVCAGLAAAHKAGVLHRDLKPANIMIDEAGEARVTDFGLAALAEEVRGDEMAGTPAYMSPEQLAGRELTPRSDIYSLGLVLYELFTGRKAFEARTLPELLRLRRSEATPTSPSNLVKDLDPLVERVILRCLEADPKDRPPSALQVAAALPGGDPLAAALAMGETPSPEMVAAAPKEGTLRPAFAMTCLGAVALGFVAVVMLSGKVFLHEYVRLDKRPEALRERAAEVVRRLGYTETPTDTAYDFLESTYYLDYLRERDTSPGRWEKMRDGPFPPVRFWYVQSPRYLVPGEKFNIRVVSGDPPLLYSGMTSVILDPQGRLLQFERVPPQVEDEATPAPAPDWTAPLREAGLDPAGLTPARPRWLPASNSDERVAWEGAWPGHPDVPLRVEAAGFRGRLVYFDMIGPWQRPWQVEELPVTTTQRAARIFFISLFVSIIVAAVLLARRNLRLGQGDRRGALRLSAFFFACCMLGWALAGSHVPTGLEFMLLTSSVSVYLLLTGLVWIFYVALEPLVRRRWPHRIISWSRLLAGDWRDPLVGRDLLFGATAGITLAVLLSLARAVPPRIGMLTEPPEVVDLYTLLGPRELIGSVFHAHLPQAILISLGFMFLLLLLRIVLRRERAALTAAWIIVTLIVWAVAGGLPGLLFAAAAASLSLFVLARFGLLATTGLTVAYWLCKLPLTSDLSAWYASGTLLSAALVGALAGYASFVSLGGQKLVRANLLED